MFSYCNMSNFKKKQNTINDNNFEIPIYDDFELLNKINYKVPQLKEICSHYKLKKSGNKNELKNRIYDFLFNSKYAILIQKTWRRFILLKCNKLKGPALFNRKLCINSVDFLSMDSVEDIPYEQFFSYKDSCQQIYGFDILSLCNLYLHSGPNNQKQIHNPFNRQQISQDVITKLFNLIKKHKLCGFNIKTKIDKPPELSIDEQIKFKTISVFQEIDNLGNYTDVNWFTSLNRINLIRFIRELYDIWNYRAQLSIHTKREICPPFGNPFMNADVTRLPILHILKLKEKALFIMECMISRGINNASKSLGANYILCALTLVNTDAAENLPWLYQSVSTN